MCFLCDEAYPCQIIVYLLFVTQENSRGRNLSLIGSTSMIDKRVMIITRARILMKNHLFSELSRNDAY